jgi:hypothetical protein
VKNNYSIPQGPTVQLSLYIYTTYQICMSLTLNIICTNNTSLYHINNLTNFDIYIFHDEQNDHFPFIEW